MLAAMMDAQIGDDVFGEDQETNLLEEECAALFGMEAGLFCPSGTMANQIGLKVITQPYDEVVCYSGAHIYRYEGGGMAGNSGLSVRLLHGDRGRLSANDVLENINPDDPHFPRTAAVALENTVNKGGGCYYTLSQIAEVSTVCQENNLMRHLDGARLFNALVATGEAAYDYGQYFDTISVCLSKGLGAPIGSVLMGSKKTINQARRVRKHMGGGMRQVGYLAAAGRYALKNHQERLQQDHDRAKSLAEAIQNMPYTKSIQPVDTNIVIVTLKDGLSTAQFLETLSQKGVEAVPFGARDVRFVTHLDYDDDMLERTINVLKALDFDKALQHS